MGSDRRYGGNGNDKLDGGTETDTCDGGTHVTGDTAANCETVTGMKAQQRLIEDQRSLIEKQGISDSSLMLPFHQGLINDLSFWRRVNSQ